MDTSKAVLKVEWLASLMVEQMDLHLVVRMVSPKAERLDLSELYLVDLLVALLAA